MLRSSNQTDIPNLESSTPNNRNVILFRSAYYKDKATVKSLLLNGVVPDCTNIHETCNAEADAHIDNTDEAQVDTQYGGNDLASRLANNLSKQLQINRQQGNEISFLLRASEEAAAHGFIIGVQKEISEELAAAQQAEVERQIAQSLDLKAKAEQQQRELLEQQQEAEKQRIMLQQRLEEEQKAAQQRLQQELAEAERIAAARVAAEQAKILARQELDKPTGGPHHKSHLRSALHIATLNNDKREISRLIEAGATVEIKDSFNHTPLWYAACQTMDLDCVNALLKGGAQTNAGIDNDLARLQKTNNSGQKVTKIISALKKR